MNFPLFIARRIYSDHIDDQQKVSKPAIRIAVAGVAIGLAVMIISVCVVLGFKHTIRDKVVGFGSHIQVANFYTLQSSAIDQPIAMGDSMMNVLKKTEGVKHVQRFAMKQGILKTDNDFLGVMFKGVGRDEVRIAYVLKKDDLGRALIVLRKALEAYPGRVVAKE